MMLTPEALRPLLRQMTAEMGSGPAIMHWLTGCPEQPLATGPHSVLRADYWTRPPLRTQRRLH